MPLYGPVFCLWCSLKAVFSFLVRNWYNHSVIDPPQAEDFFYGVMRMIKRLFDYLALAILAVLGLAKLKGKRVNPLALRVLLAILSFMAMCLDSAMVLIFSGTWLLFLLASDAARMIGIDLRLFVPVAADGDTGSFVPCDDPAVVVSGPEMEPKSRAFWSKCATRCKSFFTDEKD